MAKSKKTSKDLDLNTAEQFYKMAEYNYRERGKALESGIGTKGEIEGLGGAASIYFYQALSLGSKEAPYSLYACFGQGIGVNQSNDIAAMMFGVARKLGDKRCEGKNVVVPKSVQSNVNLLTDLIKEANKKIPTKGVSMDKVFEQMEKFQAVKVSPGKSLQSCFTEESTVASTSYGAGASSSQHNASYETGPDTSLDSEDDVGLAGSSHPHM
ncbi:hypothetical protein [Candidatus Tisiphia endosymbiont of Thecophora atra]|uniref:hypothetical protein n=1 Tax=Candidatus Tisiphia endosymbiont of Thecophora atra TaxID=3066258 RepID=UPI00312CA627